MDRATTPPTQLPPSCDKCERTAVVLDAYERPLCARHATIFMTVERLDRTDEPALAATGS